MAAVSDEVVVVITAQHGELQKGLDEAGAKLEGFADEVEGISGGLEDVFAGLGVALTAALDAFIVAAYEIGNEFESAFNKIRARTGETGTPFEGLQESLKNVMTQSAASSDELSNTLTKLHARLGLTGEDLERLTLAETRLAKITGSDVNSIVDISAKAFNAWGISVDEQVPKLDEFMRAYQQTGINVDVLAGNLQRFAPILQELGFSFDQSVAMISQFDQAGIIVQQVMRGMQTGIKDFAAEGESSSAAFARMVQGIKDGTVSLDEANKVFGSKAGLQLFNAIRDGKMDVDSLYKTISGGSDTLQKAAADIVTLDSAIGKFVNRAKVSIEPFAMAMINIVEKTLLPVLDRLGKAVLELGDMFNALPDGTKDVIVQVSMLLATLATGAATLKLFSAAFAPIVSALGLSGIFEGIAAAVGAALGPIALVAAGLIALGYVLYDLWNSNAEFRNEILAAWTEIQTAMDGIMANIRKLFDGLKQLWLKYGDDIMAVIQPMWENLKNTVGNAVLAILDVVNAVLDVLSGDWEGAWFHLADATEHVMNIVIATVATAIDVVKGLGILLGDVLYDVGVNIYTWGNETGTAMYTGIYNWGNETGNAIKNWFKEIGNAMYAWLGEMWDKVKAHFEKMKATFSDAWERIKGITIEKVSAIVKAVPAKFNEMKDAAVAKVQDMLNKMAFVLAHLPEIFMAAIAASAKALKNGLNQMVTDAWNGASSIADAISSALSGTGDAISDRVDEAQSMGKDNAIEGLYSGLQSQLDGKIQQYKDASEAAKEKIAAAQEDIAGSMGDYGSSGSSGSSGTDELLEKYNKFGDAVADALKEYIDTTAELQQQALDDEIDAVREATDEKIKQYNREYDEKCALIDAETERFTGSLTEELASLEEAQEEADRKATAAANKSKLDNLRLEVQIARAENDYEALAKAEANLAAEETRQAMEAKKAELEKQKQEIRDQIDAIKAQADAMKEAAKKELDKKTTTASDNATNRINILEQQKEEATAFWESMSKEENVQAETYKLAVGKHQDEVIALLATYNPKWQDAGRSYGDMFLNGLQSSNIEAAVASMLSGLPGANMADVASTVPGLDALVANQKATAPGGSAGYGFNPADLAAAFSQALAPLVSTGKEITINLDGTMLGRLMLPKLITEAERSGLALV